VLVLGHQAGRLRREVDEQHVTAADCPLDAGHERDAKSPRDAGERRRVVLPVVERDGDGVVAQVGGAFKQRRGRMRNPVVRVVGSVDVQVDLQHAPSVS